MSVLPYWKTNCNDINKNGKISNFIKSRKTKNPSSHSGATSLPPIGKSFMFIEKNSNNHDKNVFVSWERTDIIQITNMTFSWSRFSNITNDSLRTVGRFRIQLLLQANTWSTQHTIAKNIQ